MSWRIFSTYSLFSLLGLVSSNLRLQTPLYFFGYTEVHADGLGVTDVKVAVRLWWKTGLDATSVLTFLEVFLNQLFNERDALCFLSSILFSSLIAIFYRITLLFSKTSIFLV